MMLKGLVLVLLVVLVSGDAGWYHCRDEGDSSDCCLGNGRRYVRFGAGDQWTFTEVEVACFQCSTEMFGDPAPGKSKACWVSNEVLPNNEQWTFCANIGGTCKLPNHRKIKFGPNANTGYKSFYYMEGTGSIPCTTQFFGGDPQEQTNQKSCWYGPNDYTNDTWVKCADQGYNCQTPSSNAIYKIKFGNIIRDMNNELVQCSGSGNLNNGFGSQGGGDCSYNPYPNEFFAPTGSWSLVTYCPDHASCTYRMNFGVTSSTSEATSHTWAQTLTTTTDKAISFNKKTMTKSQSQSVTDSQKNAYSVHVSESCGANCNEPNGAAMYQWTMVTNEVNWGQSGGGSHISADFTTYACLWECLNSTQYVPLCPPGYCAPNTNCQKCNGYDPN